MRPCRNLSSDHLGGKLRWVLVSQKKWHCTGLICRFRCLMSHVCSFVYGVTTVLAERRAFTSVRALVQSEIRLFPLVCGDYSNRGFADEMAYQSRLFQVHCRLCDASQALEDAQEWQACNLDSMLMCRAGGRMSRLMIPLTTSTQKLVES